MKTITKEQLTSYALDELSPSEREQLETLLEKSPEDQAYTQETHDFCQFLQETIGGKEAAGLTEQQRAVITQALPIAAPRRRWPLYAFATGAAAAIAVWLAWPHYSTKRAGIDLAANTPAVDWPTEIARQEAKVEAARMAMLQEQINYTAVAPPATELLSQGAESQMATISPAMPPPLFAGTPLPTHTSIPNLEARHYAAIPSEESLDTTLYSSPLARNSPSFTRLGGYTAPTNESYIAAPRNTYKAVADEPLSTFSIDVDTASYANVRRFLNQGQRPPVDAVRLEELVNYFRYAYPAPAADHPCSITADVFVCPWNEHHRLARVGVKARTDEARPAANLVFLLDVSGSMDEPNKLPLVKQSLRLLVEKLTENDRVSIVVYAGASGLVLAPTHGTNKQAILDSIESLQPGGSTNGASGITLAYAQARQEFKKGGVNRVILATDGDFNVGISDREGLQKLIETEAKSGVFLSVLGYGMGNLKDSTMETLADKGNGNYAYIDSLGEARKVLAEEMSSTLVTVAKDVKIQIEFNPAKVRGYKLLGYENRMLNKEDFNNDKIDAGEMGAGHTVTALYEITPTDAPPDAPAIDPLKYQPGNAKPPAEGVKNDSPEIMTVKLRYKAPDGDASKLMAHPVLDQNEAVASAPGDFKFATAVAGYAMLLRGGDAVGNLNWEMVRSLARDGKGNDVEGYRGEFMQLVEKAAGLVPDPEVPKTAAVPEDNKKETAEAASDAETPEQKQARHLQIQQTYENESARLNEMRAQAGKVQTPSTAGSPVSYTATSAVVPAGVKLISSKAPVTSSDPEPFTGTLDMVTDGDKDGSDGYFVELAAGKQWIQIDLGKEQEIWAIWLWHYHKQSVIYKGVVVQISNDPDCNKATIIYNNDFDNSIGLGIGKDASYVETNHGRYMNAQGTKGRYVRFWSCGRYMDEMNHYIEAEIYGK